MLEGRDELREELVVDLAIRGARLVDASDRREAVDVVEVDEPEAMEREEGGSARVRLARLGELVDGTSDHVGEDLRPPVRLRATAGEAELGEGCFREALDRRDHR